MDTVSQDRDIVEQALCEAARFYDVPTDPIRTVPIFDRNRDQYLLLREGWRGFERVHHAWVHVELRDGTFWVQEDGTQDGIATDLMALGIPKERIVLAFQHPSRRPYGEFAAA